MTNCCRADIKEAKTDGRFDHLVKKHPCFNGEAHFKYGRIHLPVSPECNIQCKFCKRSMNKTENRPGVAGEILSPREAIEMVDKALELCPEITVVGVAGPGDALASPSALETFELLNRKHPQLIKCLSTNGLMLDKYAERIINSGIQTVSVTINAVDPGILQDICSGVVINGSYIEGSEGAKRLIDSQISGIRKLSESGIAVKVNTVLIPGLNDVHIEEIARVASKAGASIMNIIPLIPQNQMANFRPPDCNELNNARMAAEKYLNVFRHCRQCRADACGIPGNGRDIAGLMYDFPMETFSHG
ncbi:MAG TPA: radical SAM protein [Ruminiclostridium sp.]|nr:radical SAM protein [Ruminiclostridium sp.]